jgi:hypothetical protein
VSAESLSAHIRHALIREFSAAIHVALQDRVLIAPMSAITNSGLAVAFINRQIQVLFLL